MTTTLHFIHPLEHGHWRWQVGVEGMEKAGKDREKRREGEKKTVPPYSEICTLCSLLSDPCIAQPIKSESVASVRKDSRRQKGDCEGGQTRKRETESLTRRKSSKQTKVVVGGHAAAQRRAERRPPDPPREQPTACVRVCAHIIYIMCCVEVTLLTMSKRPSFFAHSNTASHAG